MGRSAFATVIGGDVHATDSDTFTPTMRRRDADGGARTAGRRPPSRRTRTTPCRRSPDRERRVERGRRLRVRAPVRRRWAVRDRGFDTEPLSF